MATALELTELLQRSVCNPISKKLRKSKRLMAAVDASRTSDKVYDGAGREWVVKEYKRRLKLEQAEAPVNPLGCYSLRIAREVDFRSGITRLGSHFAMNVFRGHELIKGLVVTFLDPKYANVGTPLTARLEIGLGCMLEMAISRADEKTFEVREDTPFPVGLAPFSIVRLLVEGVLNAETVRIEYDGVIFDEPLADSCRSFAVNLTDRSCSEVVACTSSDKDRLASALSNMVHRSSHHNVLLWNSGAVGLAFAWHDGLPLTKNDEETLEFFKRTVVPMARDVPGLLLEDSSDRWTVQLSDTECFSLDNRPGAIVRRVVSPGLAKATAHRYLPPPRIGAIFSKVPMPWPTDVPSRSARMSFVSAVAAPGGRAQHDVAFEKKLRELEERHVRTVQQNLDAID